MSSWYYSETGDHSTGPISLEDLGRILGSKTNSENFLVWSPGMSDWTKAGNLADLKRYFQQHTPPPLRVSPTDAIATVPVKSATQSSLHPWRRYFARILDTYVFILIFFVFLGIAFPELFADDPKHPSSRANEYLYSLIGVAAYAIFETFCLNIFGRTFGKFLYGIRVTPKTGNQITFLVALKRSLAVWVRGFGLGIPIVALITASVAYSTLKRDKQTTWDRDFNLVVLHRDPSIFKWVIIAVVWAFLLSIWVLLIALSRP